MKAERFEPPHLPIEGVRQERDGTEELEKAHLKVGQRMCQSLKCFDSCKDEVIVCVETARQRKRIREKADNDERERRHRRRWTSSTGCACVTPHWHREGWLA